MLLSRKVVRNTLIASALALALAAPTLAQDEDVSGSISILGFGLGDEIATVRADYFAEQFPNVEVNYTEGALDQQQLLTSIASGTPPDVVAIDREILSTYAIRGALQPLTQCIEDRGIDMTQYRDAAVQQVTVDGEVYGIPQFNSVRVLIINNQAIEDAGVTVEDVSTTDWDALSQLNEQMMVMEGGELTRIGFDPKLPEFFPLWVAANGGKLLSEDGRTAMLNSPENVEALEYAISLIDAQGGWADFKAFRDTWPFFGEDNPINANQIGFWPMEDWFVTEIGNTTDPEAVSFAPFTDREGNPVTMVSGTAFAIPTGAANFEAACAFVATMTSPEAWTAAAQERADLRAESGRINTGVYTGNRVADEQIFGEIVQPTSSEVFDNAIDLLVSLQDAGVAVPPNPAGQEFKQAWTDAVNRVLNGEMTAQESLDQAQAEAQAALDEAWSEIE